jgi:hypothetical protein
MMAFREDKRLFFGRLVSFEEFFPTFGPGPAPAVEAPYDEGGSHADQSHEKLPMPDAGIHQQGTEPVELDLAFVQNP